MLNLISTFNLSLFFFKQFYQPLAKSLPPKELKTLFSNIEEILMTNTLILSDFEAVQERDQFYISCIGDKFLKHVRMQECIGKSFLEIFYL